MPEMDSSVNNRFRLCASNVARLRWAAPSFMIYEGEVGRGGNPASARFAKRRIRRGACAKPLK